MNFIITNVCNLQCPYCFASNITCDEHQFATNECLLDIISIAMRTKEAIAMVGGEPTVHPDFINFFNKINNYNKIYVRQQTVIYTNGILLHKFYDQMKKEGNFALLVNVNDLGYKNKIVQDDMIKSLKMMSDDNFTNITLGCNIHLGEENYDYIFDTIKKYNYKNVLRVSTTTPTNKYSYLLNDMEKYFEMIKPIFMNFIRRCKKEGVLIGLDCNKIPPCMLSYDEAKSLKEVIYCPVDIFSYNCNKASIDIDMNYDVTRCFATRDHKINIKKNKDRTNIALLSKQFDKICNNDCKMGKDKSFLCLGCSGGCNFFTKKED